MEAEEEEHEFMVGRKPHYDVALTHAAAISRTHAKIHYCDELFWEIEDLGSATGTYVCVGNGKCYVSKDPSDVDISRELEHGSIISVPGVDFMFKYL